MDTVGLDTHMQRLRRRPSTSNDKNIMSSGKPFDEHCEDGKRRNIFYVLLQFFQSSALSKHIFVWLSLSALDVTEYHVFCFS